MVLVVQDRVENKIFLKKVKKKRLWTSLLRFIERSEHENHDKMTHKKKIFMTKR